MRLHDSAKDDRLMRGLPTTMTPFHWHGDIFDLPPGAVSLASSDKTPCQAFRHGDKVYGFQFHIEVTRESVAAMAEAFAKELVREKIPADRMIAQGVRIPATAGKISDTVFSRWASPNSEDQSPAETTASRLLRASMSSSRRLRFQSPSVTAKMPGSANRTMARDDNRNRIRAVSSTDGPHGARPPDKPRDFRIGARLARRNRAQLLPYRELKRSPANIHRRRRQFRSARNVFRERDGPLADVAVFARSSGRRSESIARG